MTTHTLILDKGERQYVFRYTPGSEGVVTDRLWRLAEDRRCELDWIDAATLTFLVLCRAACDAGAMHPQLAAAAIDGR
jgi:hypothetical protein